MTHHLETSYDRTICSFALNDLNDLDPRSKVKFQAQRRFYFYNRYLITYLTHRLHIWCQSTRKVYLTKVTLTGGQGHSSRSNFPSIAYKLNNGPYLYCYLTHKLYTWHQQLIRFCACIHLALTADQSGP